VLKDIDFSPSKDRIPKVSRSEICSKCDVLHSEAPILQCIMTKFPCDMGTVCITNYTEQLPKGGHHLQRYVGTSNFMDKFYHLIKSELVSSAEGTKVSK
jgi:hypothetical protein